MSTDKGAFNSSSMESSRRVGAGGTKGDFELLLLLSSAVDKLNLGGDRLIVLWVLAMDSRFRAGMPVIVACFSSFTRGSMVVGKHENAMIDLVGYYFANEADL
jgi:hypothetical protein